MLRRAIICGFFFLAASAAAQEPRTGPLTAPPKREVKRIPIEPKPEPPPVPVEEIIRRFTANEDQIFRAFGNYAYRQTVRLQEFDEDGQAVGQMELVREITIGPDGKRYPKITSVSGKLRRVALDQDDLEEFARVPAFILTSDQLGLYELTYLGHQPLDELTTYAFRVQPKRLERTRRLFEGVIWVDDRDFVIVKTYGKLVSEVAEDASKAFFLLHEIYREPIEGKIWFPTYVRSDDVAKTEKSETQLRLTIRFAQYKLARTGQPQPPPRPQN